MANALPPFTIEFDFTSDAQQAVLDELQQQGYSLLIFQGTEFDPAPTRVPIWLLKSFNDIFGVFTLTYAPQYKVYVTQGKVLGAENVLEVGTDVGKSIVMSNVVPLGTSLVFNKNGSFTTSSYSALPSAIELHNAATATGLTAGLAASIEGVYSPFCAAPISPDGNIRMAPINNLLIGVAKLNGPATAGLFAPGAEIIAAQQPSNTFTLAIEADGYAVVSTGSTIVKTVTPAAMSHLATGNY